tara:strand:+ start:25561 stop:26085 length:525 start_codon:yes stop_codon:yes gene_type:complete
MNKALFLDRDGVVNIDKEYLIDKENTEFITGVFDLIRCARVKNYLIIIVTNQSGIGRGIFSEEKFLSFNNWFLNELENNNARIDDLFYCPTHPEKGIGNYKKNDFRRKPNPGMIIEASEKYNLDLKKSFLIGDKLTDMEAGHSAGVKNLFLYSERCNCDYAEKIKSLMEVEKFL